MGRQNNQRANNQGIQARCKSGLGIAMLTFNNNQSQYSKTQNLTFNGMNNVKLKAVFLTYVWVGDAKIWIQFLPQVFSII